MGRNRLFKGGQELELEIIDIAFGGKGIAKVETEKGDFTIFVPNTIPGQKVLAKVKKSKKRYAECILLEVIERAPEEVEQSFQPIPGAPYMSLPIEEQIKLKKRTTFELYKRIGEIDNLDIIF